MATKGAWSRISKAEDRPPVSSPEATLCDLTTSVTRTLFRLFLVLLLTACSNDKAVVRNSPFQKRTLRPGWHVDLSLGRERKAVQVPQERSPTLAPALLDARIEVPSGSTLVPLSAEATLPQRQETGQITPVSAELASISFPANATNAPGVAVPDQLSQEQVDTMPKKRWNRLAIPAFVLALLTVFFALFTVSTTAVILVAAATIVLAGVSLKQIRREEQAGKGFALAALIIGLIAALITAISIIVVGFV